MPLFSSHLVATECYYGRCQLLHASSEIKAKQEINEVILWYTKCQPPSTRNLQHLRNSINSQLRRGVPVLARFSQTLWVWDYSSLGILRLSSKQIPALRHTYQWLCPLVFSPQHHPETYLIIRTTRTYFNFTKEILNYNFKANSLGVVLV